MKTFINFLFIIISTIWLVWLIAFPIYKKGILIALKDPKYAFILCILALILNLLNLFVSYK